MRTWLPFAAAVTGAVLVAAGTFGPPATWLFAAVGTVSALAGLVGLGGRGAVSLLAAGAWLLMSALVGWSAQWNALAGGLLVLATAFLATAAGSHRAGTGASS